MHVVIVGSTTIGTTLAKWLVSAAHEVVVVEKDLPKCTALDDDLGSVSMVGDGTDEAVLAKAGANRAEVVVAATSRDDVNLAVCQVAKQRFDAPRTVCLVTNPGRSELFRLLGVDVVIDITELALGRIQEQFAPQGLVELLPVAGHEGKTLVSVKIPAEAKSDGRLLKDITLPEGTIIPLVITRNGGTSIPSDETTIRGGDEVIALTTSQEIDVLKDLLAEQSEE